MDKYNHWLGKLLGKINNNPKYAITLNQTAYYSCSESEVDLGWHRHEDKHKEQWKNEGIIKFAIKYIYYNTTKGYKNNPYEIEAEEERYLNNLK
jgi:hypothetical protein